MILRILTTLIFLATCVHSSTLHAQTTDNKHPSHNVVRIGYLDGFGLVHSKSGKARGYLSDLFRAIERRSSDLYEFVPLRSNDLKDILAKGDIDIFALGFKTKPREELFAFGDNAASITRVVLVIDEDTHIFRDDVDYMNGKSVTVLPGVGLEELLERWLRDRNIHMNVVLPQDVSGFFTSDTDFHLTTTHYLPPHKKIVTVLQSAGLYFMSTPERKHALESLQHALEFATERDADLMQRLYSHYISPRMQKSPFLTREQAALMRDIDNPHDSAVLTALAGDFPPMQYADQNGNARGITLDILTLLSEKYPAKSQYMVLESKADVSGIDVLCTVVGHREEKARLFLESDPYLTVPLELIMQKKLSKNKELLLGILDYSSLDLDYVRSFFPQWKLTTFLSYEEMFDAYSKGAISGMLLSSVAADFAADYAMDVMDTHTSMRLHTSLVLPYTLYISKRLHPESIKITNAFIASLDPIEVNSIVLNELDAIRPQVKPLDVLLDYSPYMLGVILLAAIAWLITHSRTERQHKDNLMHMLSVDTLTGLASERKFMEVVEAHLLRAQPGQYILGSVDLDNFSIVNRNYGYDNGNELLRSVASNLLRLLPSAIILSRQKDDIFLILMKNVEELDTTSRDAFFTQTLANEAKRILDEKYSLSMSFGCYVIKNPATPLHKMIDYCTVARQVGKSTFGFVTTFFTEQMQEQVRMQSLVLGQMKAGIDNREFFLVYQPKVDLQSLQITGAEALVRWCTDEGSIISPEHFIPIFEKNGFITQFDHYVFEMVCQYIHIHRKSVYVPPIAVNMSGHTLLHADTPATLQNLMNHYDISATEVDIEITESAIVSECENFIGKVNLLKNMGFNIALDDFGTGVSCLNRLRSIPLDVVKLDKAFLDANMSETKGCTIVDNIVSMLQKLNIKVVAEGVESVVHTDWLTHIGCDVAQGFYFSKPVRGDRFFELLKTPPVFDQLSAPDCTDNARNAPNPAQASNTVRLKDNAKGTIRDNTNYATATC